MKTCPACGHENDPSASFCSSCGKPLQLGGESADFGSIQTVAFQETGPIRKVEIKSELVLSAGDRFADRYEIVSELGRGGMGVVYRATEQLGSRTRDIALKLIRADRAADVKTVESLLAEGALIQEIGHPNVVKVYNVGKAQGRPFVAMKYVDGITLREWHRRRFRAQKEVSLASAASIIRSILAGLGAAHELGVIHRDLKPENIILTGEPSPDGAELQILDFGIAREPDSATQSTNWGPSGMMGTIGYMAPEQKTYPEAVRPSADLYSLSHIFYELLMDGGIEKTWQPPSGGRPDIPTAIDDLIQKGISTRPRSRPQSVEEYRRALDRAVKMVGGRPKRPPHPGENGDNRPKRKLFPGEIPKDGSWQPPEKKGGASAKLKGRRPFPGEIPKDGSWQRPSGSRAPLDPGEREVVPVSLFVTPKRDASGKLYMPDMVDDEGNLTEWNWMTGYTAAYSTPMQIAFWVAIGFVFLIIISLGGG